MEVTAEAALDRLKEGNARFQSNLKINRDLLEQVNRTAEGQSPFAVILSCIDSRTSVELIFDLALGDPGTLVVLEMRPKLTRAIPEKIRHPLNVAIHRGCVDQQQRGVEILNR